MLDIIYCPELYLHFRREEQPHCFYEFSDIRGPDGQGKKIKIYQASPNFWN
jgi:hypothetical protein